GQQAADGGQERRVADPGGLAVGRDTPGPAHHGLDRLLQVAQVVDTAADVGQLAGLAAQVVLGVQRHAQHGPAVVDRPDAVPVGDTDVAVVDGVVHAAHGGQCLPLDAP